MTATNAFVTMVNLFVLATDATTQQAPLFGAAHCSRIQCVLLRENVTSTLVFLSGREQPNPLSPVLMILMVSLLQNATPLSI